MLTKYIHRHIGYK